MQRIKICSPHRLLNNNELCGLFENFFASILQELFNLFHANFLFLYPMET